MYMLAKIQLYILKTFEATALQSSYSSNRKIDLYSRYMKMNYRHLLKWM